jgi:hypothetical protein
MQAAATLLMLGVALDMQFVHYPLFARVSPDGFAAYEREHQRRIVWIVIPAMSVEGVCACIVAARPPAGVSATLAYAGLAIAFGLWLSTAFLQVPQHRKLQHGFEEPAYRMLLATSWIRTIGWSARAVLVLWMLQAGR